MDSGHLLPSRRAQSSVIGIVLIIGLTLAAASAVVVFGSGAIDDGRQQSRIGQAEQAMTQFDSRAAQVALGESDVQTVRFGQGGGDYTINQSAGSVKVYHENYNEYNDTETVFAEHDLGVLRYRSGETTIAYQGGGVWRSDGDGASVMVSPPEFHYRTATLTFPIIRVTGEGGGSGRVKARVTNVGGSNQVYPNGSQDYSNSSRKYLNPIDEGNMTVEIQSQYCQGWRSYFESRTEGVIEDRCSVDNTVRAELATLGTQGAFSLQDQTTLRIRGMSGNHSLKSLELRFVEGGSNAAFDNFNWSVSGTDEDGNEIGIAFYDGGKPCKHGPQPVRTVLYYNNASNDDYGAFVLEKSNPDAYHTHCEGGDTAVLAVDLLNASRKANYTTVNSKDPFKPEGSLHNPETFDQHSSLTAEPVSFTDGDQANISLAVQHYFTLLGDADLETNEQVKGKSSIGPESSGNIEYEGNGRVVTFLHITDNELQIEFE